MTDKPRRKIRVRRKRRSGDGLIDAEDVGEAVGTFGCCLFEVVLAATSVAALVAVPTVLLW